MLQKLNTAITTIDSDKPLQERRAEAEVMAYNSSIFEPSTDPQAGNEEEHKFDKHFAEIVDCSACGNKSEIAFVKNGEYMRRPCECRVKRINIIRLEKSGLLDMISKCSFENYQTPDEFQQAIKKRAVNFLECVSSESTRKWYFIGGQVGSGKTHICTAIVGGLIGKNYSAKYMMYRDEAVFLKGIINKDPEKYKERIDFLKSVEVLYIDDLFKTKNDESNFDKVTPGDVNLVFEIINARYNSKSAITVISSEKSINEIIDIDEGIGSRIRERSKGFCENVKTDKGKNWRLRG